MVRKYYYHRKKQNVSQKTWGESLRQDWIPILETSLPIISDYILPGAGTAAKYLYEGAWHAYSHYSEGRARDAEHRAAAHYREPRERRYKPVDPYFHDYREPAVKYRY